MISETDHPCHNDTEGSLCCQMGTSIMDHNLEAIMKVIYKYHMGPRVASKIPSRSPRAEGEARGLRNGIFDATRGPIWYFYYLIVYFMNNICKNRF